MPLLLRKMEIFVLATALALSGATSLSHAKPSAAATHSGSLHQADKVQHYADLVIDAAEDVSSNVNVAVPTHLSHDDGQCKNCCAACMTASLMPAAPSPIVVLGRARATFPNFDQTLVAHSVPTDPGIPKPL